MCGCCRNDFSGFGFLNFFGFGFWICRRDGGWSAGGKDGLKDFRVANKNPGTISV